MALRLITLAEQLVEVIQAVSFEEEGLTAEPFFVDWDFWRSFDHEQGELDELTIIVVPKLRVGQKVGQDGWQHQLELSVSFEKKLPGNDDHQDKLAMQQAKRDAAADLLEKTEVIIGAIKTAEYGDVLLREPRSPGVADLLPDAYHAGLFQRVIQLTFDEEFALTPDEE